jgi:hypothetical protein
MNTVNKKLASIALVGLISILACQVTAKANPDGESKSVARVKSAISKLGSGPEARIEVKLRDKTRLKGYVSRADVDAFVVIEDRSGNASQITYREVKQVKGKNNLTGEEIALVAVGIGVLVFALFLL